MKNHPEDQIVNLDKVTYAANPQNLKELENNPNYTFIKGDICDAELVNKVVGDVDIIVHFAAESHVDRSLADPGLFLRTNIMGTYNLLDAALKNGNKRFHHISTDEVYGALSLDTDNKFSETTPYDPRSPYSSSKASSDHFVMAFHHSFGLPTTITNCSNNYGPFQSPEKFIPRMITNIMANNKVPVYGDGMYVRDWLYVEDHCRAIEAVLLKGKIGETYCVGGMTENVNNLTLTKTILSLMNKGEDQIEFVKDRPGHDRRYTIDWSKINRELGWSPKYTFEEALKLTIDWYVNNESWWKATKEEAENFYIELNKNR